MSVEQGRRFAGVFNEDETKALKEAYRLALYSLAMTHSVDGSLQARLADLVLKVFMTERVMAHHDRVDIGTLASRSIERYLTFHNLEHIDEDVTLH